MGVRRLATGNKAITQLQDFWHANHGLGMIFLVRKLHEKAKNVRNELISAMSVLNQLKLTKNKANEHALRVQQAVVDPQLQ